MLCWWWTSSTLSFFVREFIYWENLPIVIVARCTWFCIHIRHIVRQFVPNKWTFAWISFARQPAAQFASLCFWIVFGGNALTRFQSICQTNWASTFAHIANGFLVANGFVRFIDWQWTVWHSAITETGIATAIVVATSIAEFKRTFGGAAGTLRWTAAGARC